MDKNYSESSYESSIFKILLDDLKTFFQNLKSGSFRRPLSRNFRELKEFFLDEDRKNRLATMGRLKRWIYTSFWLLKALLLKLSPVRRVFLVIGLILLLCSNNSNQDGNNNAIYGGLILILILMFELKDKLLAKSELRAGHAVQTALMPERKPRVPGWELWLFSRPANEVGGDLLDFQHIKENRFGIALGDVADKGLKAALLMAKLLATLRALAPDFKSLSDLGAKINEIFYRDGLPSSFASLVYLELQTDSESIRVLNAGHIPPIVLKTDQVQEMPKGDLALGISPKATYSEQNIELGKGDWLLVYSDGLTEARNEEGDFFGDKQLLDLLPKLSGTSVEEIGEKILAEVDHFVGEAPANDDLSLVVLKRVGSLTIKPPA